ncbi:MAG TPA: DegT/DnrJ/EryC1/StrS family aminotransferase [Chloroflexia bacterium]|nr:DegT/DnrJ/EryC1/StrS family aminotransferase [Chloroflexia bacterium]
MAQVIVTRKTFVPVLPTLWPRMLLAARGAGSAYDYFPFSAPDASYFYFARIAIWVAAGLLGLAGGEVLVPAYHHGVEIEALIEAGALLNFYRVGRKWEVDPKDVERHISPRTKAIYLTHYAGFPGPVEELREIADRHGLPLIEDCALSLLSKQSEKPLGSTGDFSVFCLYKTLPVPNGGVLVVNGKDGRRNGYHVPQAPAPPLTSTVSHMASSLLQNLEMRGGGVGQVLRSGVRRLGRGAVQAAKIDRVTTGSDHFNMEEVDLGMSALSKRILMSQEMDRIVKVRRRNYRLLLNELREVSPPLFDDLPTGICPLFYPLVVEDKEKVMQALERYGIETVDFWRYFHPSCDPDEFPDTAWLRNSILEIPCHQDMTVETVRYVAGAVRDVVRGDGGRTTDDTKQKAEGRRQMIE